MQQGLETYMQFCSGPGNFLKLTHPLTELVEKSTCVGDCLSAVTQALLQSLLRSQRILRMLYRTLHLWVMLPGKSGRGGEAGSFCSVHDLPWHFWCTHSLQAKIIAHIVERIRNMYRALIQSNETKSYVQWFNRTVISWNHFWHVSTANLARKNNKQIWKTPNYFASRALEGRPCRNL